MFVHIPLRIDDLIINLIWLYFGGKIFISYLSSHQLTSTYLMGGIIGAFTCIICFNVLPVFEELKMEQGFLASGASSASIAILIASATHVPNFQIHILSSLSIRLKYIAILAVLIDILTIWNSLENGLENQKHQYIGGGIGHLGGALYGYLFIQLRKRNINTGYLIEQIMSIFSKNKEYIQNKRFENDYDYNARKKEEEEEINKILDKINKSGYDSLSNQEKETLFNQK